jgi:hypothetical protein
MEACEDAANGGGTDPVAKTEQLTPDALVAPARVVAGHPHHEVHDRRIDRWAAKVRVGPVPGGQPAMPPQQRRRRDQPMPPHRLGKVPGQGGEDRPVGPIQAWLGVGTSQDRLLVTQDQDLHVLVRIGSGQQRQPLGQSAEHQVDQAYRHDADDDRSTGFALYPPRSAAMTDY